MRRWVGYLAACALALFASAPASADNIAVALAEPEIEIDVDFDGARVTLFAVSSASAEPDAAFAVALVGPKRPYTVARRTETGVERFDFISAPTFLSIAAEAHIADAVTPQTLIAADVNARFAAKPAPQNMTHPDLDMWRRAFVDLKTDAGLFRGEMDALQRLEGGLIRADIDLPAEAPAGAYDVRAFVFRDGDVVAETSTALVLERKGAESFLYNLADQRRALYGLIAIITACAVGGLGAYFGRR